MLAQWDIANDLLLIGIGFIVVIFIFLKNNWSK